MSAHRASQLLVWILPVLIFVPSPIALPSESCQLDQVPFFINQAYLDIVGRPAGAEGQSFWGSRLGQQNTLYCRSENPAVLGGGCEWNNAAQLIVEVLNSPESISKNGSVSSNHDFVVALYRVLLRRAPDAAGLKSYVSVLDSGGTRTNMVFNTLTSDEYRKRYGCQEDRERLARTAAPGHADLGVNGHPLTQAAYSDSTGVSFEDQLTQVQNLGAKWYRFDLHTQTDLSKVDVLLKTAQAHGIQLLPGISAPVDRDHDTLASVYQKSRDGAFNVVSRYKSSIHIWELSNEEDIYCMHRPGDSAWSGGAPGGDQATDYNPQKYAIAKEVLRGLADGVHAADGSALRIINFGGWLHTGFLQRLQDDGIAYEIVAIHWYQDMQEITCPGQTYPCPGRPQHFNVLQRVQAITKGKPMWITEINYRPVPGNSLEANIAREQSYLAPTLERFSTYPFQVMIVYELLDEPNMPDVSERQYGLFSVTRRPDGGFSLGAAKPAYQSVQRIFKH